MKYNIISILVLSAILGSVSSFGQTKADDEKSIRTQIEQLFTGLQKGDSAMVHRVFHDSAVLHSITESKSGMKFNEESLNDFLVQIASLPLGTAIDERLLAVELKAEAHLAQVWTPYEFYVGGKLSHCGTNAFQFGKIDGEWKILHIVDTRRRACK